MESLRVWTAGFNMQLKWVDEWLNSLDLQHTAAAPLPRFQYNNHNNNDNSIIINTIMIIIITVITIIIIIINNKLF